MFLIFTVTAAAPTPGYNVLAVFTMLPVYSILSLTTQSADVTSADFTENVIVSMMETLND